MRRSYACMGLVLALAAVACTGTGDGNPTVPATVTSAVASPNVGETALPSLTATATATPATPITGLFRDPRFEEPDASVELGPLPPSVFPPHDGRTMVLYDIERGTSREFGPGILGVFSPDNRYMAWTALADDRGDPSTLRVVDLNSGEVNDLGEIGSTVGFSDERRVQVRPSGGGRIELVDVETGQHQPIDAIDVKQPELQSDHFLGQRRDIEGSGEFSYRIFDRATNDLVLSVAALDARIVPDDQLLLLVDAGPGVANIFLVDLDRLDATFVATTLVEPFRFSTIPLVANGEYVVWTPNACDYDYYQTLASPVSTNLERREGSEPTLGRTMVYNRTTGTTTELTDATLWIAGFSPDGRFVDGGFGGEILIDPGPLAWDVVLPQGSDFVSWSPDYRYAAMGEVLGHGGLCPE